MMTDTLADTRHIDPNVIAARLAAHWMLEKWGVADGNYRTLERLLKLADIDDMTDKHIRACKLLCGPHGWAYYRVLVIRREMKDENENVVTANAGT